MYGPYNTTRVHVEQYINEKGWPRDLGWEGRQATLIIERWKLNGMQHDDIGYLADVDEIYTRDYIRAMQICDVPEFDAHGNCKNARVGASALVFEGGPLCAVQRSWFHPDLTIGECIEGINKNPSLHPAPERGWKGLGWLSDGYHKPSNWNKLPKNTTHYPLFNAPDFRMGYGWGNTVYTAKYSLPFGYNAFHLHNSFPNAEVLRNKYKTYMHPVKEAMEMAMSDIHDDLKTMIQCAFNQESTTPYKLLKWGLDKFPVLPIAFQIEGYVDARMAELKEMLSMDGNI